MQPHFSHRRSGPRVFGMAREWLRTTNEAVSARMTRMKIDPKNGRIKVRLRGGTSSGLHFSDGYHFIVGSVLVFGYQKEASEPPPC
jgi:hypothetical protein